MLTDGSSHATGVKMNTVHQSRESVMRSHASSLLTVNGRPVEVHAMLCGSVTVRRSHAVCSVPERTPAPLRFLAILADRKFADPMPIWCYAIDHPEGLFVVDAGAAPSYNDPTSWEPDPRTGAVIRSFIKLDVADGQTLPDQLRSAGLQPDRVRAIVLTHQHIDHTGTVPEFPAADVWTTRAEDAAANRIGALHWRWRDIATTIRHVDVEGSHANSVACVDLTSDGTLTAMHTPGHTPGSVTVRLAADQGDVWFTGDTSFTAAGMDPAAPTAGIHSDMRQVRLLQSRLQNAGLLLPSHDPTVPDRLEAAFR